MYTNPILHREFTESIHNDVIETTNYTPVQHTEYIDETHTDIVERQIPRTIKQYRQIWIEEDVPTQETVYESIQHTEQIPVTHTDYIETRNVEFIPHEEVFVDEHIDIVQNPLVSTNPIINPTSPIRIPSVVTNNPSIINPTLITPIITQTNTVTNVSKTSVINKIRFINTIANSKSIDLYINGNPIINELNFDDITNYYDINRNSINIVIKDNITDRLLYDKNLSISSGNHTFFIHGSTIKKIPINILIFKDDNTCPKENTCKIRFINTDADVDNINFSFAGYSLDNMKYGNYSNYMVLTPGVYDLRLYDNNNDYINSNIKLSKNMIYTMYVVGIIGDNKNRLKVKYIVDNKC